jgi:hypothetical protein
VIVVLFKPADFLHIELFHFAIEVGAMQAEEACGVGHIILGLMDTATNKIALEFAGGIFESEIESGESGVGGIGAEHEGEVFGFNAFAGAEEGEAFHEVSQFADISWPGVSLESTAGFGGE